MFTGIVTALGTIRSIAPLGRDDDMRLVITAPWPDTDAIAIGASIGCSGCCLTAVEIGQDPGLGRAVGNRYRTDRLRAVGPGLRRGEGAGTDGEGGSDCGHEFPHGGKV